MPEATAEAPITLAPESTLPKVLKEMSHQVDRVYTEPAKVSRDTKSDTNVFDAELPFPGSSVYSPETTAILARLVTNRPAEGPYSLAFRTRASGRADYFHPVFFALKDGKGTVMSVIMTKGSGAFMAGFRFTDWPGGEIRGAATINDLRLDAEKSKKLHEKGIRARVALGVFDLDEINYRRRVYTRSELLRSGIVKKEENLPGMGIFASRGLFRVEEVKYFLIHENFDPPALAAFLKYLIISTRPDDSPHFKAFYQRHQDLASEEELSRDKRKEVLADYLLAFSGTLGQQAALFEENKAIQDMRSDPPNPDPSAQVYVTDHNITCLAESVDNSSVKFEASVEDIAGFQTSLVRDVLRSLMAPIYDRRSSPELKELMSSMDRKLVGKFLETYLDEIKPGWRDLPIPENFFERTREIYGISPEDIKRSYWFVKVKDEKLREEKGEGSTVTQGELVDLVYEIVLLNFHSYSWKNSHDITSEFLDSYASLVLAQTQRPWISVLKKRLHLPKSPRPSRIG